MNINWNKVLRVVESVIVAAPKIIEAVKPILVEPKRQDGKPSTNRDEILNADVGYLSGRDR